MQNYLTLASCTKGEETYIVDFIRYHRFCGVQKFIFFDREFTKLNDMLNEQDFPDVEVVHFPEGHSNVHAVAWANAIRKTQGHTQWLMCIDLDQAMVPVQTDNICEVLKNYEQYASLQCNWHTFGSSGHETRTSGSLFERFLMRAKSSEGINNHTQFICQPSRTLAIRTDDPHHPKLPNNEMSVNTNKQKIASPFNMPPLHDVMWVAHYINKSKEEFIIKNNKGRADIFGEKMPFDMFRDHDAIGNIEKEERVCELWNKALQAGY